MPWNSWHGVDNRAQCYQNVRVLCAGGIQCPQPWPGGIPQIHGASLVAPATDTTTPNGRGEVIGLNPVPPRDLASTLVVNLPPPPPRPNVVWPQSQRESMGGKGLPQVPANVTAMIWKRGLLRQGRTPTEALVPATRRQSTGQDQGQALLGQHGAGYFQLRKRNCNQKSTQTYVLTLSHRT